MMIFARRLVNQGRIKQFTIERGSDAGWIAQEEDERAEPKTNTIRDWHHVEAIMVVFDMKASALRDQGWAEL
jgi:hypothetical protein